MARPRSFRRLNLHPEPMRFAGTLFVFLGFVLAACGGQSDPGPPVGWEGDGADRWWRTSVDTTGAFRNLETLESMGVRVFEEVDLAPSVQNRMLEFYRSNPEIVDSVFAEYGLPVVERGDPTITDRTELRESLLTEAYLRMVDFYRDARPDPDVPVEKIYPDSLRDRGVSGRVELQIRVDAEGEPITIQKLSGVDPTLDARAMQAATKMRWFHAGHAGEAVASWTRVTITY